MVMRQVQTNRELRRMLESDKVRSATDALSRLPEVPTWAVRFGLLGDPSRLALLVAIAEAGPISVTDLAIATNMYETTVSQSLRLLRAAEVVVGRRDGRIVRYELSDPLIAELLRHVTGRKAAVRGPAPARLSLKA